MNAQELLKLLHDGRLGAGIIEAWLRAGRAELLAEIALGVAIGAFGLAGMALRLVAVRTKRPQ